MKGVITFLSDFGSHSGYAGAMKGVAASLSEARLVDLSHDVAPYDIRQGAFLLLLAAPHFPPRTVHCAVVDPGVGTDRQALIVVAGEHHLVGPDNGLLLPAARALGLHAVYRIENPDYLRNPVSDTFHGRDVFAPVAAHLANGVCPEQIGSPVHRWVDLDFGRGVCHNGQLIGEVICWDTFGTITTNLTAEDLRQIARLGDELELTLGDRCERLRWVRTFGEAEGEELILIVGSHGFVEIAVNLGNACERFSPRPRLPVVLDRVR